MDFDLGGKAAVVTGGSKGIGLSTALALSAEGAVTTLVARNEDALNEAKAKVLNSNVIVADLGTEAGRAAMVEAIRHTGYTGQQRWRCST